MSVSLQQFLVAAASDQLLLSAHDVAEGGLAIALAEATFAHGIGADVDFSSASVAAGWPRVEATLFGESAGVVLLSVLPERTNEVLTTPRRVRACRCRRRTDGRRSSAPGRDGSVVVDERVADAEAAWGAALELALQGRPRAGRGEVSDVRQVP